jgi:hypothetical protein
LIRLAFNPKIDFWIGEQGHRQQFTISEENVLHPLAVIKVS